MWVGKLLENMRDEYVLQEQYETKDKLRLHRPVSVLL